MKEFMLYIRNIGNQKSTLDEEQHLAFLKKCELYIQELKKENRLISAQPLVREGVIVSGKEGAWTEELVDPSKLIQVGYYHIFANSLGEAVGIAKANPEFAYSKTAQIEVRPVKTKEDNTGFVYPVNAQK